MWTASITLCFELSHMSLFLLPVLLYYSILSTLYCTSLLSTLLLFSLLHLSTLYSPTLSTAFFCQLSPLLSVFCRWWNCLSPFIIWKYELMIKNLWGTWHHYQSPLHYLLSSLLWCLYAPSLWSNDDWHVSKASTSSTTTTCTTTTTTSSRVYSGEYEYGCFTFFAHA